MQVANQGADALIEERELDPLAAEDVVARSAVPVPFAVVERHDTDAGLDESAGHQHALRHARGAVVVDENRRDRRCRSGPRCADPLGDRSSASASFDEVSSPIACSVEGVDAAIVPLASRSRRIESKLASSERRSARCDTLRPRSVMSSRVGPVGRNGAPAMPRKPGPGSL